MGNYKEIDGDLIKLFQKGEFDVIAHGCNCYATMGAGIALTIGNEFPEAMMADEMLEIPNGKKRLGKLSYAEIEIDKKGGYDLSLLFNLYTQYNPGRDFRMPALKSSIKAMKKVIKDEFTYVNTDGKKEFLSDKVRIGLPLIGCGIAGGDWNEVSTVIKEELKEFDVTIIHFKQKVLGVNHFPRKTYTKRPKVNWEDLSDEEFAKLLKEM
jgi:O-acetyl-ADP-ribose deacetylase (regulator of RNase III)